MVDLAEYLQHQENRPAYKLLKSVKLTQNSSTNMKINEHCTTWHIIDAYRV